MMFFTSKYACLSLKLGQYHASEGISLPSGELIKPIEVFSSYKYLGILESSDVLHTKMTGKIRQDYFRRLHLILKSQLNSQNKISAINAYCLPAIRYTTGIVDWNLNDLRAKDRKTRKLLTINRELHPRSDVDHVYLSRKKGGRGLKSVDVLHKEKCSLFTISN